MKFEEYIRKEIESLDQQVPNGVSWTPERSWRKINFALRGSGSGRLYFHYYLAAAVSFALVLSGSLGLYRYPGISDDVDQVFSLQDRKFEPEPTSGLNRKVPVTLALQADVRPMGTKIETSKPAQFAMELKSKLPDWSNPIGSETGKIAIAVPGRERPRVSFSLQGGMGIMNRTLAPNGSIKLALLLPGNTYRSFGASVSMFGFLEEGEVGKYRLNPAVFVNAEFGRIRRPLRKWTTTGWEVGIGYLVADQSNLLKENTIRIYTRLPITRHLKVVPELIFTNNLKTVLPGMTISLG